MTAIDDFRDVRPAVPSALTDFRQVPLAELPTMGSATLSDALKGIFPEPAVSQVSAAFQSSI